MSTAGFPLDDPVDSWVLHVQQGFSIETVPEEYRAQVERRLGRLRESGLPVVAQAAPKAQQGEPWWRGTWGVVVAVLLPLLLVGLLLWWLSRLPQQAGGGGFVEGFGKLKVG
jgi:hypothetical protein